MSDPAGVDKQRESGTKRYELQYELTPEDVVEYVWSRWSVRAVCVAFYTTVMALVTLLVYKAFMHFTEGQWSEEVTLIAIVWIGAVVYFGFRISEKAKKRVLGRPLIKFTEAGQKQKLFGERRVTVSRDQIAVSSPRGDTVRPWDVVRSVKMRKTQVIISTDRPIVIPRRAFKSDDDCEEFVRTIRRWCSEASKG